MEKNEIKHDHLKFIAAKEKSYTAKTKRSQPKKIIRFKNRLLMVKTKVAVRSFWSKAIQVCGASLYDMSMVLIFAFLFAYLWLLFYERATEWQACTDSYCSIADHLAWQP